MSSRRILFSCIVCGFLATPYAVTYAQAEKPAPKSELARRIDAYLESPKSVLKRAERARILGEEFEKVVADLDLTRGEEIIQELQKLQLNEVMLFDEIDNMRERVQLVQKEHDKKKSDEYAAKLREALESPDTDVSTLRKLRNERMELEMRMRHRSTRITRSWQQGNAAFEAWIKVRQAIETRDRNGALNALRMLNGPNAGLVPRESLDAAMEAIRNMPDPFDDAMQELNSMQDLPQVVAHMRNLDVTARQDTRGLGRQVQALGQIQQALELGQSSSVLALVSRFPHEDVHPKVELVFEELRLAAYKSALEGYGVAANDDEDSPSYARRVLRGLVDSGDLDEVHLVINKLVPNNRAYRNDVRWMQSELDQVRSLVTARRSDEANDFARAATHLRNAIESRNVSQIGLGEVAAERLKALLAKQPDLADGVDSTQTNLELAKQVARLRQEVQALKEIMTLQRAPTRKR